MSQTNYSRYKYNPDEINEQEFLSKFVVRQHDFDDIFEDLKQSDYEVANQHYIVVGQRGQGKTTLLRKIMLEVKADEKLSTFILPIKFSEEQYQIRSLSRLWEEVADYLQAFYREDFVSILNDMECLFDDDDYEFKAFSYLESAIKAKNKKALLLIDNIDELLDKLKEKEQRQLREILLTSSTIRIVGGSTKMLEQHFDYGKPFYEFFKLIKLTGLNKQECITFLSSIGDKQQTAKIKKIIENTPERIETLRRLTGGVPRTMVMLFDIFVDEGGDAFEDLLKVLDDATPLYKHRMDDLPEILQDITHTIAMNWDGLGTKDIAKKTKIESKSVSAQLKQLETKYGIIESTSIGKNKIYKIEERFFNIWYLMRFGRKKDRQRVEWLVNFLTSWCSQEELTQRAHSLLLTIKNGKAHPAHVYHMCEALSYTGLDRDIEHKLKQETRHYLTSVKSNYLGELTVSEKELFNKVIELHKHGEYEEAIKLLKTSNKSNKYIMSALGLLYREIDDYPNSKFYYQKAIEAGELRALINLGILYKEQGEIESAVDCYQKAIEAGESDALFNLGILYQKQGEIESAVDCYQKAIEAGESDALVNLGNLYQEQGEVESAVDYYQKAIEAGESDALFNLGILYQKQGEIESAVDYYQKAIEAGESDALVNLGVLYQEQGEIELAVDCYQKAIEAGDSDALVNLGILYKEQGEIESAEDCYQKAIEAGELRALFNLGILYKEQGEIESAEDCYQKAIEAGESDALVNLGILYKEQGEIESAVDCYQKAIEAGELRALFNLGILYKEQGEIESAVDCYQKAIEAGESDALVNLGNLYKEQGEIESAVDCYQKAIEAGDSYALVNLGNLHKEQGEIESAVDCYQKAIEAGESDALVNLGNLYQEQGEVESAVDCYQKAIEAGESDALFNLGILYQKQGEIESALDCYQKAAETNVSGAGNSLAWLCFDLGIKPSKALIWVEAEFLTDMNFYNSHTYACTLLWNEKLTESENVFLSWLQGYHTRASIGDVSVYITLLIAKKQLYKTKEILELPEYSLKNKLKPIWYALMTLMQDEFPHEILKMGSEQKDSVEEILEQVELFKNKYALPT
jgi:tetratricopeptide (TPR) repeat protein